MSFYLPPSRYPDIQQQEQFYGELEEKLGAIPGVRTVGATTSLPLNTNESTGSFLVEGRAAPAPGERTLMPYRAISPDYFRATGIALLKGRAFDERDRAESTPVLVINETMARRIWSDENPLGRRIAFAEDGPWHEVVGVAADTKHYGLDEPARGAMYAPSLQRTWRWMSWRTFILRTGQAQHSLLALLPRVRNELKLADAELPIHAVDTLDAQVAGSMAANRFSLIILGAFADAALALASIGIYGVIAFAVGLRSREMGLRMALGASRANVVSLIVSQAMKKVWLGLAGGLVGAVLLTRFLASSLYGVEPTDATTLLLATIVLATVALGAVYWPARRATRLDPMLALRHE
ncbi:MAG: FtsX-like permease family protein [Acidobacteria bacterium]|nr:MAG: FtsX-like permease family protein [Acidobacteriota bacterium]